MKRVKAPNAQYFEYKTLDRHVQLDENEVVGAVIFLDYHFDNTSNPPLIETEDLDTSKIFEYIDSNLQNPLDNIRALNLFEGGSATTRHGFQIKSEQMKRDYNEVLESDPQLKVKVIDLVKSYLNIWVFYGDNKTYGFTEDIKFNIEFYNPNT